MKKLMRIGAKLNGFKFQFDDCLLNEIRDPYHQHLQSFLTSPRNQQLFEGGRSFCQPIDETSNAYFLASYNNYPLLWVSANTYETYLLCKRFFDSLKIEDYVKKLVDYDEKIIIYSGFLVIGDRAPDHLWHTDYDFFANAYTLLTPLFELERYHGNLLYKTTDAKIEIYPYVCGEAIIIGNNFIHSTEPYSRSDQLRILVSITFGTDQLKYWNVLKNLCTRQFLKPNQSF